MHKSLQSFKDLFGIVAHGIFDPGDIYEIKWDKINKILSENVKEEQEGE